MSWQIEISSLIIQTLYEKKGVHVEKTGSTLDINTEDTTVKKKNIKKSLWFVGLIGLVASSMDEEEIRYAMKQKKLPKLGNPPHNL